MKSMTERQEMVGCGHEILVYHRFILGLVHLSGSREAERVQKHWILIYLFIKMNPIHRDSDSHVLWNPSTVRKRHTTRNFDLPSHGGTANT